MCLVSSDSLRGMSLQEKWTYEGPASLVILFFTHCATYLLPLTVLDHLIGTRLEALQKCTSWCSGCTSRIGGVRLARTCAGLRLFVRMRGCFQGNPVVWQAFRCFCFLWPYFPMSGWVCQWKPFWIPIGESFQKVYLEEWIYMGDDSSYDQGLVNLPALVQDLGDKGYIS